MAVCCAYCNVCTQDIDNHYEKRHNGMHPCDLCEKSFTSIQALSTHKSNIHVKNELVCNMCSSVFQTICQRGRHVIKVHSDTHKQKFIYVCESCDARFSTHVQLTTHLANCMIITNGV